MLMTRRHGDDGCKRLRILSLTFLVSSLTRKEELVGYYNNNEVYMTSQPIAVQTDTFLVLF